MGEPHATRDSREGSRSFESTKGTLVSRWSHEFGYAILGTNTGEGPTDRYSRVRAFEGFWNLVDDRAKVGQWMIVTILVSEVSSKSHLPLQDTFFPALISSLF